MEWDSNWSNNNIYNGFEGAGGMTDGQEEKVMEKKE